MAYVINVVGSNSNVGKTTLIVKIIEGLKSQGFQVATIKHDTHEFDIDKEGKDTWRHKKAGANAVVISSKTKVAIIKDTTRDTPIEELVDLLKDEMDFIIVEGYKGSGYPKIEVYRKTASQRQLTRDETFLGIATDSPEEIDDSLRVFDINNAAEIVRFLIQEAGLS